MIIHIIEVWIVASFIFGVLWSVTFYGMEEE